MSKGGTGLTVAEYDDKLKNNAHISHFFVGRRLIQSSQPAKSRDK